MEIHFSLCISQFQLRQAPPPRATAGHLPALSAPVVGHLQILHCPGAFGICQQQGHSRAFDTHAVSHQDITTQKALLEKKQIDSSVKDRNKLKRVVRVDFMHAFLHCLSSNNLYIAKTGAIDVNQRFLVIELNFC